MNNLRHQMSNGASIPSVLVNSNREDMGNDGNNRVPTHRNQSTTSGKLTIKLPSSDIPSTRVSFALEQMQMVPASTFNAQSPFMVNPDFPAYIERPNIPAIHRASGEQSVSVGPDDEKKYNPQKRRKSLWNTANTETLADIEDKRKHQQEELFLQQQSQQYQQQAALDKLESLERNRIEAEQTAAEYAADTEPTVSPSADTLVPSSSSLPTQLLREPSKLQQMGDASASADKDIETTSNQFPNKSSSQPEEEDESGDDVLTPLHPPLQRSPSKFKSKDVRQEMMKKSALLLTAEENEEVASIIDNTLHELTSSKSRDQLHTLRKYVMGHTRRKVVANWNMIENRFKTSSMTKSTLVRDKNGLEAPIKQTAIYASALTSVLCSTRVKISHRELTEVLTRLGATEEVIHLARQIAAHHVVIGICQEAKSDLAHVYTDEMQKLLRKEHFLVGIHEFEDLIFSDDLEERKKELEALRGNRQVEVQQMLEEKKKKEEKKEQILAGRKKLIDEFEKILGQIQLLKAPMNISRVEMFQFIVDECRVAIHDYYEEQTSKVPMDLLSFLGIDVFPMAVQEKLRLRLEKLQAPKSVNALSRGMAPPTLSRSNSVGGGGNDDKGGVYSSFLAMSSTDTLDSHGSMPSYLVGGHGRNGNSGGGLGIDLLEGLEDPTVASVTSIKLAGPASLLDNVKGQEKEALLQQKALEPPPTSLAIAQQALAKVTKDKKGELLMAKKKAQLDAPVAATSSMGSIISCLRGMVAIGKTFPGVSYREAVEMLQYVACTKIATAFRGYTRRWRFMSARYKWRAKYRIIMHRHYTAWASMVSDFVRLRNNCWRKLKAWQFYTRYTKHRRESFRIAFWPLYTWRKYASASRTAKEKTKFLVGRMMPTITTMRIFRAWRDYSRRENHSMRLALDCTERKRQNKARDMLTFLRFWAFQRRRIRSAWSRHGQAMRVKNIIRLRCQTIQIWRSFAWIRRYARLRIRSEFWLVKQTLLAGKKPLQHKSLADRRLSASTKRYGGDETAAMNQSMNKVKANMNKKTSLVGNNARKAPIPKINTNTEDNKGLEKVVEECRRRYQRYFTWKNKDIKLDNYFDIDSDGEDEEDLPPKLLKLYRVLQPKFNEFEQIVDQPFNLSPFDAAQRQAEIRQTHRQKMKVQDQMIKQYQQKYSLKMKLALSYSLANTTKRRKTQQGSSSPSKKSSSHANRKLQNGDEDVENDEEEEDNEDENHDDNQSTASFFSTASTLTLSTNPPEISFITQKHFESAQRGYELREIWNLYDAAWRFHRIGHLAFHNLRMYARVKHRVRLFTHKRRKRIMNECWATWHEIVEVARRLNKVGSSLVIGADGMLVDDGTGHLESADVLVYRIRSQHTSKVSRTRKISEEIRLHATNIEDDEEEARKRYIQRMKNLNLIADDDDEYLERQRQQALVRIAENKIRLANQWLHGYLPPNLLDLDRRDRLKELKLMKDMLGFGVRLKEETTMEVQQSDLRHKEFVKQNTAVTNMVEEVLLHEGQITEQAVVKQLEYAAHFKEHAADLLISTLAKVREEVLNAILKAESKVYFRALRLPMLITRSYKMYNRKILRNQIRICKRLVSINRLAPYYYHMRKKWVLFNAWLQYIEKAKLHPSAGFARMLRRRLRLHPDYHNKLQAGGFINKAYTEDERLRSVAAEFHVIFSRWKMCTQESIMFRMMNERVTKLARLRTLRKFFWGLKHQLSVEDPDNYRQLLAIVPNCFPMIQIQADLDQITRRFIPIRKKLLPQVIKTKNQKVIFKRKVESKEGMTFKKFLNAFSTEVSVRISMEQRLLFEAFEDRGSQQFVHRFVPESRTEDTRGLVPTIMSKLEATSEFADPRDEDVVPGGFRLSKLKFAMVIVGTTTNAGSSSNNNNNSNDGNAGGGGGGGEDDGFIITSSAVLGWQLLWTGEGCTEIESRQRGMWHAAGMTVQEIVVPKDDFVSGIEYMYDGAAIVAVRCRFYHNGWSRWIGGKTSLSTLSMYIPCDASEPEDFENERVLPEEELRAPALPYTYVMGLTGLIYNQKVTCLGLIVRKIVKQNIFSYHWVQDRLVQQRLEDGTADSGPLDQLPSITGMDSLPSEIEVDNPVLNNKHNNGQQDENHHEGGGVVGTEERGGVDNAVIPMGESLTLSHHGDDSHMGFDSMPGSPSQNGRKDEKGGENDEDEEDDDEEESHDVFTENDGDENKQPGSPSSNTNTNANSAIEGLGGKGRIAYLQRRFLRQFQTFDEDGNRQDDVLSRAEQQFFDTIRMRMTEVAAAKQRVIEFARFLWSTPTLRNDGDLKKLLSLKIVSGLARWLFNSLSRRLLPVCSTEKQGLRIMKHGRRNITKGKGLWRQAGRFRQMAIALEQMRMPWTGKGLLGPAERAARKEHQQKIANIYQQVRDLEAEGTALQEKGKLLNKQGDRLMPKLAISWFVYNNFRHKVAAARHKETLLERMSIDDIKKGFFGANMKETLLNRDQMQAIHASLRDRKIEMKDTTSLQRLLTNVLVEEEATLEKEQEDFLRKKLAAQRQASLLKMQKLRQMQQSRKSSDGGIATANSSYVHLSESNSVQSRGAAAMAPVGKEKKHGAKGGNKKKLLSASMPSLPSISAPNSTDSNEGQQVLGSHDEMDLTEPSLETKKDKHNHSHSKTTGSSGNGSKSKKVTSLPPIPTGMHPSQSKSANSNTTAMKLKLQRGNSGASWVTLDDSILSQGNGDGDAAESTGSNKGVAVRPASTYTTAK